MPANRAASVEAVSGGASITRPPWAVRCTVRPAKSFWTSTADGGGAGSGAPGTRASRDSSPAATMASISRSAGPSSASAASTPRAGARSRAGATIRFDPGEEAPRTLERHLVARSVEQPHEEGLLRPHEVRDPRLDAGLADQVVDVDRAILAE